jgi:hypothetical protein
MQGLLEELVINLAVKTSADFTKRDYSSHWCICDPDYNIINVVTQPSRSKFLNWLFPDLFTVEFNKRFSLLAHLIHSFVNQSSQKLAHQDQLNPVNNNGKSILTI